MFMTGGIIPARAGFTTTRRSPRWRSPDHPRSRGVYEQTLLLDGLCVGSSPLARGLRSNYMRIPDQDGIIPARAGFTFLSPSLTHFRRDHPRSRGVYGELNMYNNPTEGSSPLARGLRNAA